MLLILPAAVPTEAQERHHEHYRIRYRTDRETMVLPGWGIKTNLLYDATTTFNLGVEFRTGGKTSLDIPVNYNPWTFGENRKWRHILVQPELRLWTKETFRGHFFGLHGHYAFYNVGNLPKPPFSQYMKDHRYEGWLAGAGISYGYRWNFSHRWAMEATVGVGYAYLSYDKFDCGKCGEELGSYVNHYFGPTKVGLSLIYGIGGKKAQKRQFVPPYVAPPVILIPEVIVPVVPYEPKLHASFITPAAEAVKARRDSGRAYLDFRVANAEIVPGFMNNAAELQRMHDLIGRVKGNADATITGMTIAGYASPEGTWASNLSLSERRAQALRSHVVSVDGIRSDLISAIGMGEDWAGLDSLVSASNMIDKYRILEIIRGTDIFDGREGKLMMLASGNPYRQMLAEMFPRLRRAEYTVNYTVAPFTVARGKEVLRTDPGSLSLEEMFLIANTYEMGSDDFNEVFEIAARYFPNDDTANINAAASALTRKDAVSAARYLDRVREQNVAYWNNLGILSWLQGDREKAAQCFARGGAQGAGNAAELLK